VSNGDKQTLVLGSRRRHVATDCVEKSQVSTATGQYRSYLE
jgi:hypothetical protein